MSIGLVTFLLIVAMYVGAYLKIRADRKRFIKQYRRELRKLKSWGVP